MLFSKRRSYMFKYWSIKKYGNKLLPQLIKRYGKQKFYSERQIRATVYQCNFNPKYLPIGYILYLEPSKLNVIIDKEFPNLSISDYRKEISSYLETKQYSGSLEALAN